MFNNGNEIIMAKTNRQYLEENLSDEQQEWLDALCLEHQGECIELERKVSELETEKEDLESDLEKANDRELGITIHTGIGAIRYETEGSLDLVQLMEAFAEAVKDHGATKVLRDLEAKYAV